MLDRFGSSRTENNYGISPGPALPTDATPRTRSVLGGPSPGRGDASGFRRTFEAQRLGAHVARRARTAAARPRSTPATSTRSFVSRRHKSRGDPISRTGLQCGQFMVREASQRPVIKLYTYKGASLLPVSSFRFLPPFLLLSFIVHTSKSSNAYIIASSLVPNYSADVCIVSTAGTWPSTARHS